MLSIEGMRSTMNLEPKQHVAIEAPALANVKLDDAGFEASFKAHFIPLCTYCEYRFGFCLDVAKEVTHIAFIRVWENRESISPTLSLKAYLYKIATNISLDMLKHEKVKQAHEKYMIQHTPLNLFPRDYETIDIKALKHDIDQAVMDLPKQMRNVFELSRYEGLKYLEIAKLLGISVKTVETQMSRALVKLRQKLAHYITLFFIFCVTGF